VTDPTWTGNEDGDLVCIRAGDQAVLLVIGGQSEAVDALVRCVRDAGLLPAALDVIARMVGVIRDLNADGRWTHDDAVQTLQNLAAWLDADVWSDAERAVLDLTKDRQP
jgi:hypothetical protein